MNRKLLSLLLCILPVSAFGADKFIVRDSGNAIVYRITERGSIFAGVMNIDNDAGKVGFGLSTGHSPETSFHIADITNSASRGAIIGQHNSGTQAANLTFRKSRGSDLIPTAIQTNDFIGAFHGAGWNGSTYVTAATVNYIVDGTVTPGASGNVPVALLLSTGSNSNGVSDPGNKTERLRVTSGGNVVIGNSGGVSTATPLAVDATDGHAYIPSVDGTFTACASIYSPNTGHSAVWIDITGSKICTCISGTLKCAALL